MLVDYSDSEGDEDTDLAPAAPVGPAVSAASSAPAAGTSSPAAGLNRARAMAMALPELPDALLRVIL
eukprot:1046098-Prymnesium_polylepis.1